MSDSQSFQSAGRRFSNQKLGWSCVCVLLCCCHSHRRRSGTRYHGHHLLRNPAPFHLWTLLLCHRGYRRQSPCRHGWWTAFPPALEVLWPQSVANGDHLSSCPVESSYGWEDVSISLFLTFRFSLIRYPWCPHLDLLDFVSWDIKTNSLLRHVRVRRWMLPASVPTERLHTFNSCFLVT